MDLTGAVQATDGNPHPRGVWAFIWPDLRPIDQGYTRAMFDELSEVLEGPWRLGLAFANLHPLTFEANRLACTAALEMGAYTDQHSAGEALWADRQAGRIEVLPPLRIGPGSDGRIYAHPRV